MKKKLIILAALSAGVLVVLLYRNCKPYMKSVAPAHGYTYKMVERVDENYAKVFTDNQARQFPAAKKFGIKPTDESGIKKAVADGGLVKIEDCNLYYLSQVTYPYLTPSAEDLLAQIGMMHQANMNGSRSRLRVTSCLRTEEHIRQLRTGNGNAVENSCHLYGTTFDISYKYLSEKQRQALARALQSLRKAGYCYVKYEINQPCFHITVRQ